MSKETTTTVQGSPVVKAEINSDGIVTNAKEAWKSLNFGGGASTWMWQFQGKPMLNVEVQDIEIKMNSPKGDNKTPRFHARVLCTNGHHVLGNKEICQAHFEKESDDPISIVVKPITEEAFYKNQQEYKETNKNATFRQYGEQLKNGYLLSQPAELVKANEKASE